MESPKQGVVLVGHGGIPKDCPHDLVMKLKRLEAQRRSIGGTPTPEEIDLDQRIRHWPRTPDSDPYQAGLEKLATHLHPMIPKTLFRLAYNEYCTPTLEEAVDELIGHGVQEITVVPSMFTPGGSHSEVEIPETLEHLHRKHPNVFLRYAWPFDLDLVAALMAHHVNRDP